VLRGLAPTDRLVINPADSLADGDVVTMAAPQTEGVAAAPRSTG
jgi:hypothetical protein